MCFSSKTPVIQPLKPAPTENDAEVQAALEKEKELARKRKGMASTILTSGLDTGVSTGASKTLLGQ